MSTENGFVLFVPSMPDHVPVWWKIIDGQIDSRSGAAARAGMEAGVSDDMPVMLVVPSSSVTMRRVDLPADMTPAQARTVAARMAREASIEDSDGLHTVPARDGGHVAVAARSDVAHYIAWAREQGVDPDVMLPAWALIAEPEVGFVRAQLNGEDIIRGKDIAASATEPWMGPLTADEQVHALNADDVDHMVLSAFAAPPINLRAGEFAKPRKSGVDASYLKRLAMWAAFIALATLLISLALIAKYHWSASRLDAKTVEAARSVLPAANDAKLAEEELDRMLSQRGAGGFGFTGPAAGLMTAMQGAPGVSLTTLSRGDDGLVHATLASARADDINKVLLDIQAADYTITATSSADPGGRVIAQITVMP
ncbi:MAG: type II secretion system protein GspL [Sphingobium sp.]|nr:general secretion pathway protein GspL [Sphingobium sp.]MCP5400201.1 general secretion pathway protein GspL [Sphingomonas sp.]